MTRKNSFLHYYTPYGLYKFTQKVSENFGFKFTLLLSSTYYGIKGVAYYFAGKVMLPYQTQIDMKGQNQQLNDTIGKLPWSIKGFIGVISDSFALFGYEKKYYMILGTIFASIACASLIFIPYSAVESFNLLPGLLFFLIHFQGSCMDLLCEGKYVDIMKKVQKNKKDVVTYIWFCQTVGEFIPSLIVGFLVEEHDPRIIFIISFPFTIQPLFFLFTNCMVDDKAPSHLANKINLDKWRKEWKFMTLALIMGILILGTLITALIGDSMTRLIYGIVISVILIILAFVMMPTVIAKGNIYIFIIRMLYLNVSGPTQQFYVKESWCTNGPHFDWIFYSTISSVSSTIFNFIGLFMFQLFVSNWKFRPMFWVTSVLRVIGSIFDIIIIERWNLMIGIPDQVVHIVGNTAILEVVYMMDFMPMNLLIARLCPRHVETTLYAILAGYMNFGSSMSSYIGIWLADMLKIDTTDEACQFDNLTYLILIGHFALPLLTVPLTFVLIPDCRPDDDVLNIHIKDEHVDKYVNKSELKEVK